MGTSANKLWESKEALYVLLDSATFTYEVKVYAKHNNMADQEGTVGCVIGMASGTESLRQE